jgi:hypothetical protein
MFSRHRDAECIPGGTQSMPHLLIAVCISRRAIDDAAFTPCSDVFGTAMRPNPEATRPNRGAIIFYRAFGAVKDKPSGDCQFRMMRNARG